jgi:ribosomal protein S18 acetylase RimI-like enzyme
LQTWLDEPDDIHLVAESEGRIAGYVWASVSTGNTGNYTFLRRNLFVNVLAVDETQRRRGIGRELFNAVEIAARDYDAEVIQLNVLKQNEAAITFYRSLGYETMSVNMTKTLRSVTRIEGL